MEEHPFGSWTSPINAEVIAKGSTRVGPPQLVDDKVVWSEPVPEQAGRITLMSQGGKDILGEGHTVGSRVHEYGGGDWWFSGETFYFSNREDSRLYKSTNGYVTALTPVDDSSRFADGCALKSGTVVCIRETHDGAEPKNQIVSISADGSSSVLVGDSDFVSNPRLSPDGSKLCWLEWDHPNMSWDYCTLKVADFGEAGLSNIRNITDGSSAPQCPDWLQDGRLVYSDDQTGYWNLYRHDLTSGETEALTSFSSAEVGWNHLSLGDRVWVETEDGQIAFVVTVNAIDSLASLNPDSKISLFETGFVSISSICRGFTPSSVVVLGAKQESAPEITNIDLANQSATPIRPPAVTFDKPGEVSMGSPLEFESDGVNVHAFFYPPVSSTCSGPVGELPPLIVMGHGGPTGHNSNSLSLKIQFWTSRGFAVADVNYRGSTGFGRQYREMLNGQWGVADFRDQIAVVDYLVSKGLVRSNAAAIRGASSGGLTVMSALINSQVFQCGVSIFGVSSLIALAKDTHKFESRYLDRLIGPYPESADLYEQRSPSTNLEKLDKPMLFLHGSADTVVPLSQSQEIYDGLRAAGVPCELVVFEGEGHGFKQPDNVVRSLDIEWWFYSQVFGFDIPESIDTSELSLYD